mmetsp:Transcript_12329/g.31582  ORF Transcript_12329/g.31582 Transcript_12329/m.31582 type:complete len:242 (+) Transcript_12329:446-1171(+)
MHLRHVGGDCDQRRHEHKCVDGGLLVRHRARGARRAGDGAPLRPGDEGVDVGACGVEDYGEGERDVERQRQPRQDGQSVVGIVAVQDVALRGAAKLRVARHGDQQVDGGRDAHGGQRQRSHLGRGAPRELLVELWRVVVRVARHRHDGRDEEDGGRGRAPVDVGRHGRRGGAHEDDARRHNVAHERQRGGVLQVAQVPDAAERREDEEADPGDGAAVRGQHAARGPVVRVHRGHEAGGEVA